MTNDENDYDDKNYDYDDDLPGLNNMSYAERLSTINLQSLEHRRLLTDLTMVYKIIHKQICINFSDFFTLPSYPSTRGHPYRIAVPLAKI